MFKSLEHSVMNSRSNKINNLSATDLPIFIHLCTIFSSPFFPFRNKSCKIVGEAHHCELK